MVLQLRNFPGFCGTRRLIIAFTRASLCLGPDNWLYALTSYFFQPNPPPPHANCRAYLDILYLITRIIYGDDYNSWSSSLCNFSSSLLLPLSYTHYLYEHPVLEYPQRLWDQVSHLYKTKDHITRTFALISTFLDRVQEDGLFGAEW